MSGRNLPLFVKGQVWQCRNQLYRGIMTRIDAEGHYGIASIQWMVDGRYQEVNAYNYERDRASSGDSYSVHGSAPTDKDLVSLIYCPTWAGEAPSAR